MRSRLSSTSVALLAVMVLAAVPLLAGSGQGGMAASGGEKYLIMTSHTPEQCVRDLDAFQAANPKLLATVEWGCMVGDHTGYVVVDAANEDAAREMLPASMRMGARIVKVTTFTPEQIRQLHMKK